MPEYPFARADDPRVTTVWFYHMNDAPRIGAVVIKEGVEWKRLASKPQASFDTRVDPYSAKDYLKATAKSGGTVGGMFDRSKEMSLKRAEKDGVDNVQEGFFKRYAAKRKGKKHPLQRERESIKAAAKAGLKVEWGSDD